MQAAVRQHPLILGLDSERVPFVLKALRSGGLEDSDLKRLLHSFPTVLTKRCGQWEEHPCAVAHY